MVRNEASERISTPGTLADPIEESFVQPRSFPGRRLLSVALHVTGH